METNPLVPRQRNRRADRQAAEATPVQAVQQPMSPVPPMTTAPMTTPTQPFNQPQPASTGPSAYPLQYPPQVMANRQYAPPQQPPQQAYPQSPRAMYQQQPMQTASTGYPPQGAYHQGSQTAFTQYQQMPVNPAAQSQPVQYAPRPRSLKNPEPVNSGWQQPTLHEHADVPHARAGRGLSRETARAAKSAQREVEAKARQDARDKAQLEARNTGKEPRPAKKKLPGWLTTAMSLAFILVLALVAAYYLMQAYLVTQEEKRIAAYHAVLDNYHVTEQPDGSLRITWQDYIEKYAAQYNLQPAFVAAIIRNESSFRTNAESNVGARGLMQMMPDTAEWIAGKLDDRSYTFDRMYDAETNIRYGCWYLGYLSRLFRGDPELVSAAYHAGQTTITQWLSDPTKSSDGITLDLDKLTDGPTKQYIGRVTQTYGIYQTLLYPDEAFGAADAVPAGFNSSATGKR